MNACKTALPKSVSNHSLWGRVFLLVNKPGKLSDKIQKLSDKSLKLFDKLTKLSENRQQSDFEPIAMPLMFMIDCSILELIRKRGAGNGPTGVK